VGSNSKEESSLLLIPELQEAQSSYKKIVKKFIMWLQTSIVAVLVLQLILNS